MARVVEKQVVDLAPGQHTLFVKCYLAIRGTPVLEDMPYSPDLTFCDFFLFPKIKFALKGSWFDLMKEVKWKLVELLTIFTTLLLGHSRLAHLFGMFFRYQLCCLLVWCMRNIACYWLADNPNWQITKSLHSEWVTVWCSISQYCIVRPFFFFLGQKLNTLFMLILCSMKRCWKLFFWTWRDVELS